MTRRAKLAAMLQAFGASFLQFAGAEISDTLRDGTVVRLRNVGGVILLTICSGPQRVTAVFNDVDAAIAAWLAAEGQRNGA